VVGGLAVACSQVSSLPRVPPVGTSTENANSRAVALENRRAAEEPQGVPGAVIVQVPPLPPRDTRIVVAPGFGETAGAAEMDVRKRIERPGVGDEARSQ
jgi:hypothetical protein